MSDGVDPDNLQLRTLPEGQEAVAASYSLSSILLSGGCAHPAEPEPPSARGANKGSKARAKGQRGQRGQRGSKGEPGGCRGLRVRLSAAAPGAEAADTLMLGGVGGGGMGGMGGGMGGGGMGGDYWQLRAKPGLWRVALKSDKYELVGGTHALGGGGGGEGGGAGLLLPMADYRGVHLPLTIRDITPTEGGEGGEGEGAPPAKHSPALAGGARGGVSPGTAEAEEGGEDGTVHVFSLASGLLYERMLRIMMASVLQRTKRKVRLSP